MQSAKRYLVIALSFAVCLTVFAAFTPRIAHAITATMVQVANTASNPIPTHATDNPELQPFAQSESCLIGSGQSQCSLSFSVPQGKRAVIEEVSLSAGATDADHATLTLETDTLDSSAGFAFPFQAFLIAKDAQSNTSIKSLCGSMQTRLYADPGFTIRATVRLPGPLLNVFATESLGSTVYITGHYVDVP